MLTLENGARHMNERHQTSSTSRPTGADRSRLAAEIKRRYDAGESIRIIAAATGRSYGFVHRLLTETGVNLRGRGGATRGRAVRRRRLSFAGIMRAEPDLAERSEDILRDELGRSSP